MAAHRSFPVFAGCAVAFYAIGGCQAQSVSFLRQKIVPVGTNCCTAILSGDFNGDGKLDLVVSYGTGVTRLALLLGNGDGTFQFTDLTALIPGGSGGSSLVSATDLNHDGKLDLLFEDGSGPSTLIYALLGNGDGTFQPARMSAIGADFAATVADFNGDGFPDLLTSTRDSTTGPTCEFTIHLGNGDGTFRPRLGCGGTAGEGDFGNGPAVGDFNGDGKLDVVWGTVRSTDTVFLWLGNGDGTFQPFSTLHAPAGIGPSGGVKPLAAADLNHDGKLDLVVGHVLSVTILLGRGDGTFQPPVYVPSFVPPFGKVFRGGIFVGDFQGNGKLDIVLDHAIIPGNGDGTFRPVEYLMAGGPDGPAVVSGDLNGDGKPDLVYVDSLDPFTSLSVLLNNSSAPLPNAVLGYSAASGNSLLAPASIASVYGKNLARATAQAEGATFPTQLGGISLRVLDSTDTVRLAPLLYVSPSQINFVLPDETPLGLVTLTIDDGSTPLQESANATAVNDISPGFFAVGQSVAAATAVRIRANGTQEPVPVFSCTSAGQCSAVPIDLSGGTPVYLSLFGTGFRNAIDPLTSTACQIAGQGAKIQFLGPQPVYPALDQINVLLSPSLPSGMGTVQCQFWGKSVNLFPSNAVQIAIK